MNLSQDCDYAVTRLRMKISTKAQCKNQWIGLFILPILRQIQQNFYLTYFMVQHDVYLNIIIYV